MEADIEVLDELKDEIRNNVMKAHLFIEQEDVMKEYTKMVKDLGINEVVKIKHL